MRAINLLCLICIMLLPGWRAVAQNRTLSKANKEYELKAFNEAITTYREYLERRPDDPVALGNLADCYRYLNNMLEASKYYARAVAQRGVEARHVLNYAHVLKASQRYEDAKRWYLEYAKDDPVVGNHYAQSCDFARAQLQASTGLNVGNENKINSPAADFGPAFYRGQVIFSSARIDIQRSSTGFSGAQPNQLYVAKPGPDGLLESPYFVQGGSQQDFNKGPISYSPDGRYVAFTKNNFVNGTRQIPGSGMELNLFIAEINPNGGWINEQPFPYNGTGYSTGFPCYSPDGNALYFASNRPEGFGGYDIYVSYRTGNAWGRPENLGPVVNSPGQEITPYFDGQNLFFASDWHPGFGGLDIFRAEQLNNRWAQIFHIGTPVSSPADDYGLIYDRVRNAGYFVSNRSEANSRGLEDIYSLARPTEAIVLTVRNASDGTPVANATLDLSACGYGLQQTDQRGVFQLQVPGGVNCNVTIRKEGYRDQTVQLAAVAAQQGGRTVDVQLMRRGEEYYGKILNYNTRLPVDGVTITAVNQLTGNQTQVLTDVNGDYTLALTPTSTYLVRYSRPGFRDINRTVRTTPGADPSLLGTISMLPADSPISTPPPTEIVEPYQPGPTTSPTTLSRGYSVQVAALSKPTLDRFSNLQGFGQVYSKTESGMHKIRVGVFATQTEAQQALAQIKRQGYPQAFVVEESGAELASRGGGTGTPGGTVPTGGQSFAGGQYRIQLGAYRNPRSFDDSRIRGLGTIEDGKKGDLTVKYLTGFSTLEQARQALPAVRAAGFTGAFILEQDARGQLNRVQ